MATYRIEYGPLAVASLALKPLRRQHQIKAEIERWAQTPPIDPTKREKYFISITGGTAVCRVEARNKLVYVITVLSID